MKANDKKSCERNACGLQWCSHQGCYLLWSGIRASKETALGQLLLRWEAMAERERAADLLDSNRHEERLRAKKERRSRATLGVKTGVGRS